MRMGNCGLCCWNKHDDAETLAEKKVEAKSPVKDRGCTDIVCCLIFLVYMLGMLIVAGIAYKEGSPKRLLYPTDSNGKICGVDFKGKPYLHFFDLTKCVTKNLENILKDPRKLAKTTSFQCPTPKVCVEKCVSTNALGTTPDPDKMICIDGTNLPSSMTKAEKDKVIEEEKCAPYYVKSDEVFYRCIPTIVSDAALDKLGLKDAEGDPVNSTSVKKGELSAELLLRCSSFIGKVGDELKLTWKWLLVGFVISMVISVLYIVLARWITFPLVVVSAVGSLVVLGYGTYYAFAKYKHLVDSGTSKKLVWRLSMGIDDFKQSKNCWLTLGIVLAVTFLIFFLLAVFLYKSARLACELIAEASRAIGSMLSTLFFPIVPWILQAVWLLWFVAVLLFLMSNGTKFHQVTRNDTMYNLTAGAECNPQTFNKTYVGTTSECQFTKYKQNSQLLRMQLYHLAGWLWGANYILALTECSLAGAFASYYWAFKKPDDIPAFPVAISMFRAFFWHSGSLALGAAIITIVQLIRLSLEYIRRKLKEGGENTITKFIICCLQCCFWCLEKCLRFINKNAYVMIAITGKKFCTSAWKAVTILLTNIRGTIAINGITGFILFLGRILITGGIGVGSFFWFGRYNANRDEKLNYSVVPIGICTIGAYIVTTVFFSVYDMGIDTLFLCYCHDVDINNGADKPYFMTKSLQNIMDKHNASTKKSDEMPLSEPKTTEA